MNRFEKFSPKHLFLISEHLLENSFDYDPVYSIDYDTNERVLKDITRHFGIYEVSFEDIEFFAKFLSLNDELIKKISETKNKELYSQFEIPKLKKFKVEYEIRGFCNFTDKKYDYWWTFDKSYVEGSLEQMRSDGSWSPYEGHVIDTDYENYEENDFTIEGIEEVSYQNTITESKQKSIIDTYDKKTLLRLKKQIDERLKQL